MRQGRNTLLVISVLSCLDLSPAYPGNGDAVEAGLLGLGIGAVVGSALTPQTIYVAPSPPDYGPAAYGPPPWSPAWYSYCGNLHGPYFNRRQAISKPPMVAGTSADESRS
jgi:hypothetical protein